MPLSSLRLLVSPLQLLSAAMWRLAKQKDVMNYEKLQEFVFVVTEAIPGLMTHRQRAQLILGLRARVRKPSLPQQSCCRLTFFLKQISVIAVDSGALQRLDSGIC